MLLCSSNMRQYLASADFGEEVFSACVQVWNIVKSLLCSDAPDSFDDNDTGINDVDGRENMSFCWRALKESRLERRYLYLLFLTD